MVKFSSRRVPGLPLAADLLIESLKNIENGKAKFIDQVHSDSTYAKKIDKNEKTEGLVQWVRGFGIAAAAV